ncbi:TetR family transcriptional regulator C-terminal domain-containing protein [Streptomyces sp. NPDC059680]|uniref:TetR family transcriptional regulator C-terminal domain-containing protein n=1 Tax=Streptomyces sp. NPDC059680 TaxID=3346904 RepID=UPI003689DE6B
MIARQADRVLAFHRGERFASFGDLDAFREWADFYAGYVEHAYQEGCCLGSLVSEIIKTDLDVHDELVSAFDRWRDVFRDGLQHTQRLPSLPALDETPRFGGLA